MSSDSIHAFVRLRPGQGENSVVLENETTVLVPKTNDRFRFEYAFSQEATNEEVYQRTAAKLIREACEGENSCLFSYGQTSSGKTFTMKGCATTPGIIPLLLRDVYEQSVSKEWPFLMEVRISYMEIYNENINDLFNPKSSSLDIRQNEPVGLTEYKCSNLDEATNRFEMGETNRKYAATGANVNSSRSHAIFRVTIDSIRKEGRQRTRGSINLIDLAGSEGIDKTKAEGATKKEGDCINKSLLNLAMVIKALGEKWQRHIPYRNSKLTRILEPSLSNGSRITVICNVNPSFGCLYQSLNTLRFGVNAGQVKFSGRHNSNESSPGPLTSVDSNNFEETENLKCELLRASSKLDDMSFQLNSKDEEIALLQQALKEKDTTIVELQEDMSRLKDIVGLQNRDLQIKQAGIDKLSKIEKFSGESSFLTSITDELAQKKAENEKMKESLARANQRIRNLEQDMDMYKENIRELEKDLKKANQNKTKARHSIDIGNCSVDIDPVKLQNAMLAHVQVLEKNKQIRQLNSEVHDLALHIEKLEKIRVEYELLKDEVQRTQKENHDIVGAASNNSSLQSMVKRERNEQDEKRIKSAQRKVGIFKNQLSVKRKRQEKSLHDLRRANEKIHELERLLYEQKIKTAENVK